MPDIAGGQIHHLGGIGRHQPAHKAHGESRQHGHDECTQQDQKTKRALTPDGLPGIAAQQEISRRGKAKQAGAKQTPLQTRRQRIGRCADVLAGHRGRQCGSRVEVHWIAVEQIGGAKTG